MGFVSLSAAGGRFRVAVKVERDMAKYTCRSRIQQAKEGDMGEMIIDLDGQIKRKHYGNKTSAIPCAVLGQQTWHEVIGRACKYQG